jgi:hypothetical protein
MSDNIPKNNIIIAGVPRAGKSTLSRLLSRKFGDQHINRDLLIAGFERVFPEVGINTYAKMTSLEILYNISGKIAPFVEVMMSSSKYNEYEQGMVLDIYQLLPDDYMKYVAEKNCEVFYLVTSDVTPEERFQILKKYDTERDYTFYKDDDELREGCQYIVEQSKLMKEQCIKHGLPYYETAREREKVFERVVEELFLYNP